MTSKIFDSFPLEGVKKRSGICYLEAMVKIINHKKTLLMTISCKQLVIKTVINNAGFITMTEFGKIYRSDPLGIADVFFFKSSRVSYPYWKRNRRKIHFLNKESEKAFFSFFKKEKTDDPKEIYQAMSAFISVVNEKKAKKRRIRKAQKEREDKRKSGFSNLKKLPKIEPGKYLPHYVLISPQKECICTKCSATFPFEREMKHRTKGKCPKCSADVQFVDRSKKKASIRDIQWLIVPDGQNLRYILVDRIITGMNQRIDIEERARLHVPKEGDPVPWERTANERLFHRSHKLYFADYICFHWNNLFNGHAKAIRQIGPFMRQFYPYFPDIPLDKLQSNDYYWVGLLWDIGKYNLGGEYEKLLKAGYYQFSANKSWQKTYTSKEDRDLLSILGVSNRTRKELGEDPSYSDVVFARNCERIGLRYGDPRAVELKNTFGDHIPDKKLLEKTIAKCRYIRSIAVRGDNYGAYREWDHYLSISQELGYNIKDKSVLFPKNFREIDQKISEEYKEYRKKLDDERKKREKTSFQEVIQRLKKAMSESPEIQRLLKDSPLIVKVPETPEELCQEHVALNNCLNTYVSRMAKGSSLIFFIRKVNDPDKAYYAMEYSYGRISQIRGKSNCLPTPEVEAFGKKLYTCLQKITVVQQMAAALPA